MPSPSIHATRLDPAPQPDRACAHPWLPESLSPAHPRLRKRRPPHVRRRQLRVARQASRRAVRALTRAWRSLRAGTRRHRRVGARRARAPAGDEPPAGRLLGGRRPTAFLAPVPGGAL